MQVLVNGVLGLSLLDSGLDGSAASFARVLRPQIDPLKTRRCVLSHTAMVWPPLEARQILWQR